MLKLLRTQQGNMPIPLLFECDGHICMKSFIYPLLKLGNSRQSGTLSSQRYGKLTGPIIDKAERLQCAHWLIVCLHYLWPSFFYTSVSIALILICLVYLYHRYLTNRGIIWNAESVLAYRTKLWGRKIQSLKRFSKK